ncbi:hypothetical protein MPL3356_110184 [Mesorhizobium plurifarium]|uniref:Uncharacterized protein n=1 Tax=Mesorhizobium plurifarium TaxID=69974 RepID=A0A090D9Y1_MESPL|nr:hypothetical protein MPL3356_110184 [Mesorhizobium plurifarium]
MPQGEVAVAAIRRCAVFLSRTSSAFSAGEKLVAVITRNYKKEQIREHGLVGLELPNSCHIEGSIFYSLQMPPRLCKKTTIFDL